MSFDIQSDKKTQEIIKKYPFARAFMNSLHGSGIDFEWAADETRNFIRLYNGYDQMDDAGYYIGISWFTVWISKKDPKKYRVTFQDRQSYALARRWATDQYLDDVVGETIADLVKRKRRKGGK